MFSAIKNLLIQGNMCESKNRNKIMYKLSMQVNLLVEFHMKEYNLYKSQKTMR